MKYIRTKDGIFRRYKNSKIIDNVFYYPDNGGFPEYRREPILDKANTIEKLCDEFVVVREKGKSMTALLDLAKEYAKCGIKTYGAIWTDKGLIYVAKMNDKGEMELL